jgi:hypothetical protein
MPELPCFFSAPLGLAPSDDSFVLPLLHRPIQGIPETDSLFASAVVKEKVIPHGMFSACSHFRINAYFRKPGYPALQGSKAQ